MVELRPPALDEWALSAALRNHFGLASMRQQLEMAGGSWQVHSRPGYGTTVTATLPLAAMS